MSSLVCAVVTGSGGYIGTKLCRELIRAGYTSVTGFDVHFTSEEQEESITKIKGDIRDVEALNNVIEEAQPDVVFHLASYGMSGNQMFEKEKIESINIKGTQNIIKACVKHNVKNLIYTSTYNVVFGGQEIRNGNESLPYFPLDKHVDHYSRTKSIAEQEVMAANGSPLKDGYLKVCSLRCAGIYGEGELRHLPRIVSYLERDLVKVIYGSANNKVDFLHVDNFIQAHIRAAVGLSQSITQMPGKAYFISDGNPINNFEFFRPLIEGLGYPFPKWRLPVWIVYYLAYFVEILHKIVGRFYNFQPILTRAEVFKTGITHYFSIEAAKRDFDYRPERKNIEGVVKWFIDRGHGRKKTHKKRRKLYTALDITLIIVAIFCFLATFIPLVI